MASSSSPSATQQLTASAPAYLQNSNEDQRNVYYYVPLARRHEVTKWIVANVSDAAPHFFNASFMNWTIRLAQNVQRGEILLLEDRESQVVDMLRVGFPNTDPQAYITALKYYRDRSWYYGTKVKGQLKVEEFDDLAAILDCRMKMWSYTFTKKERRTSKAQYGTDTLLTMASGSDVQVAAPTTEETGEGLVGDDAMDVDEQHDGDETEETGRVAQSGFGTMELPMR